jgi:protein arginine N-methyltransferase 2
MDDPAFATETDLQTQSLLLAAAHHDLRALRDLLRNTSANVRDEETGFTPLHAAIAACAPEEQVVNGKREVNGHATNGDVAVAAEETEETEERKNELEQASKTLRLLFENGAIWNDLDGNGETPGCVAYRLGLRGLYEQCVDAGVRAELLLSRLDEYQPLGGEEGSDEEGEEEDEEERKEGEAETQDQEKEDKEDTEQTSEQAVGPGDESTQSANFLASSLTFDRNRLLDDSANGVMMEWETKLMRRSAELLAPEEGLRVLNVGHGMAIIDSIFQEKKPKSHHIIEAHPDVLKRMKEQGWYEKPGVVIHEGRWQDIVPGLVENGEMFDAIYFDTFAEDYKALREFFSEHVIGMLDPAGGVKGEGGKFGFFNGMGADRQVCYDVYGKVVEMDLFEAGFDTEWETIEVPNLEAEGEWEGVRRKYWVCIPFHHAFMIIANFPKALDKYRLPTCAFMS